jgi:hypothetical protein
MARSQHNERRTAVVYKRASDESFDRDRLPDGIEIVEVLAEDDPSRRELLGDALGLIAAGEAECLYLPTLSAAAGSLGELVRLLDWLGEAEADLIAADVGFDTAQADGALAVALLREVESWSREGDPARRPRGRPGLIAGSPELAERIGAMRERGLSLQAIAEALNAEGIPTPRGGARWRPSSVQSAIGYRRPRPPVPGAPPPRPPGGGPGPPPPPGGGPGPPHGPARPGPGGGPGGKRPGPGGRRAAPRPDDPDRRP